MKKKKSDGDSLTNQPELLTLQHVILEGDKKRRWAPVHLQFVSD